jgi:hypothetical protein
MSRTDDSLDSGTLAANAAAALHAQFGSQVELDAIGDALGASNASTEAIEAVMAALSRLGVEVVEPPRRPGPELLALLLPAAKRLRAELGRPANRAELAAATGLSGTEVVHALEFSKVLAR